MGISWCVTCAGKGWIKSGWFRSKICPTCEQKTKIVHGGYMQPIPPKPEASPAPPSDDKDLFLAASIVLSRNFQTKGSVKRSENGINCLSCLYENYGVHTTGVLDNGTWYCPEHIEKFRKGYEHLYKKE